MVMHTAVMKCLSTNRSSLFLKSLIISFMGNKSQQSPDIFVGEDVNKIF